MGRGVGQGFIARRIDPFAVLGLSPGCSLAEIRKQYRKLARMQHPDQGGSELSFRYLHEAYELVNTEEKLTRAQRSARVPVLRRQSGSMLDREGGLIYGPTGRLREPVGRKGMIDVLA